MPEPMKPPVSENAESIAMKIFLDMLCETVLDEDKPIFEFVKKYKAVDEALSDLLGLSSQIGNDSGMDAWRKFSIDGCKLMDSVYEQISEFAAKYSVIGSTHSGE